MSSSPSFGEDLDFLRRHVETLVLADESGAARVALVPAYQGRVMTSSAGGAAGRSYGWVNRAWIAAGGFGEHISPFGGEDRLWIGPEAGQFGLFFAPGAPFDLAHWRTPAPLDREPFELVEARRERARFRKDMTLVNRAGTAFELEVEREVRLRPVEEVLLELGVPLPRGLRGVAFESRNTLTNTGSEAWARAHGLLSIWIVGMFPASPAVTVVVPFRRGAAAELGTPVDDGYFGRVPSERLRVDERAGVLFFRADARQRGKIGLGPARAQALLGSYDGAPRVLTLVSFDLPEVRQDYVNSRWELQERPFGGDVVNSYNDGPPSPGEAGLGAFYELESSSPALALAPGSSATHVHRTLHLEGDADGLDEIARASLGTGLDAIESFAREESS